MSSDREPAADPQRYREAAALFDSVLDAPENARAALIAQAAETDPALASEVRSLLAAHERLEGFLERSTTADAAIRQLQDALEGRYVVLERIARGGMAHVYRATDVRHDRDVAIKVMRVAPQSPDGGGAHAQRFLDEIRVTARLQHPNLIPVFDSGIAGDLPYFVMPYVTGETLRAHLRRMGTLPLADALSIVGSVAAALAHAHDAGIVHRDLKPENILLRDGQPIVCDFGIALAHTVERGGGRLTALGVVIGTPQYMSPEQADGAATIDLRSDIHALATILYEMLVGDPPHVAGTAQAVLAKVRVEQPTPVRLLRTSVPASISAVIDRALSKHPADRHPSVRQFVEALDAAALAPTSVPDGVRGNASASAPTREASASTRAAVRRGLVAVGIVVAGLVTALALRRSRMPVDQAAAAGTGMAGPAQAPATRFVIAPIATAAIGRPPTITPDGSAIVYAGSAAAGRRLFVRRVHELEASPVAGTEGALNAWVAPDGRHLAFTTSDDQLKVIGIDGNDLHTVSGTFRYSECAWLNDSTLVFDSFGGQGLTWIRAAGGEPHVLTLLDTLHHDTVHQTPVALGDGASVVFVARRDQAGPGMSVGELVLARLAPRAAGPVSSRRLGLAATQAFGFVDGWLLYVSENGRSLMAVKFDRESGEVRGVPVRVLTQDGGVIDRATLASNGSLLFTRRLRPGNAPVLVDSLGRARPMVEGLRGAFMNPRVSPDGRRIVVQASTSAGNDAWVFDIPTGTQSRLTQSGTVLGPAWTADGRRVVFASPRGGDDALWAADVNGAGSATRILVASGAFGASPATGGPTLLFQRRIEGRWSVWQAPSMPGAPPVPLVRGAFDAFMPTLSADGHWLAYASNESGRYEIYLRAFPGPGAAVQVSTDGGSEPLWSRDGRRIFYRGDRRMYVASIALGPRPTVTARRVLFIDQFDGDMPMPHRNYDLTPDGRQFVMIAAAPDATAETVVVLNWTDELRARVTTPNTAMQRR